MLRTALIVVFAIGVVAGQPVSPLGDARLNGTFLQLTTVNAAWPDARWEALFDRFKALSLSHLVIQWSAYDDLAFYPSRTLTPVARPPLRTILRLADAAGMTVLVGLAHDSRYWSQIQRDPALVDVYLRRLRLRSEAVARELAGETRAHPSFAGWYLPQELDDVNWTKRQAWDALVAQVSALSEMLHALTPGARLAMSGFSNGRIDPERLASDWGELASRAGIDTLMFQDGVGARKLEIDELEPYYAALQQTLQGPCRFEIVVETFEQKGGPPLDEGPFRAQPASLDRILRQIAVARRFSNAPLTAFSAPEYMTPEAGADAANLFEAYTSLLKTR